MEKDRARIASFDIDGVINMEDYPGVYPGVNDVIITGRSYEEYYETYVMMSNKGISNPIIYNPKPFDKKTRKSSGKHKARAINKFNETQIGSQIVIHYEDDPVQAKIIKKKCPEVKVVLLQHDLVEKENVRRLLSE